jgi:hypothetical protein
LNGGWPSTGIAVVGAGEIPLLLPCSCGDRSCRFGLGVVRDEDELVDLDELPVELEPLEEEEDRLRRRCCRFESEDLFDSYFLSYLREV